MKCPLFWLGCLVSVKEIKERHGDCLGKECAWYDSIIQQCLIYAIHTDLAYLCALLSEIVNKIPPELQFKK